MRTFLAQVLIFAGLAASGGGVHAQSQTLVTPAQVASAARDCIASFEGHRFGKGKLQKRGWNSAKLGAMGGFEQIMQGWARPDGVLMLTLQTGCIVKVRMTPEMRTDIAAFDREIGSNSLFQPPEKRIWHIDGFKLELSSGPQDGSNVSLSITWFFERPAEADAAPASN